MCVCFLCSVRLGEASDDEDLIQRSKMLDGVGVVIANSFIHSASHKQKQYKQRTHTKKNKTR